MSELRRVSARVTLRRGTAAQWRLTNPVLLPGELAWTQDTRMLKVGDGYSAWNDLGYQEPGGGGINAKMPHDGTMFEASIETAREGLFSVKEQINKWKYCAEQDFADGLTSAEPSCPHNGYLPGTTPAVGLEDLRRVLSVWTDDDGVESVIGEILEVIYIGPSSERQYRRTDYTTIFSSSEQYDERTEAV